MYRGARSHPRITFVKDHHNYDQRGNTFLDESVYRPRQSNSKGCVEATYHTEIPNLEESVFVGSRNGRLLYLKSTSESSKIELLVYAYNVAQGKLQLTHQSILWEFSTGYIETKHFSIFNKLRSFLTSDPECARLYHITVTDDCNDDLLIENSKVDIKCNKPEFLCISHNNSLLVTIKLSPGGVIYAIVRTYRIGSENHQHKFSFIDEGCIPLNKLYNTIQSEILNNGSNLVIALVAREITSFVYCSLNPIRKLFISRIKCSQEPGRFFIKTFVPGQQQDRLVTFNNYRPITVNTFDCDDKYGDFIPIEKFQLTEIGIPVGLLQYATVAGKFAFVVVGDLGYMFNPCHKCLYFKLKLNSDELSLRIFQDKIFTDKIDIDFNGQEVIVARRLWQGYQRQTTHTLDVFKVQAKSQSMTLYNLCCRFLSQYLPERKIKRLPLPPKVIRHLLINIF